MKVWVIMGNDFPDAVYGNEEAAGKYIDKKKIEKEEHKKRGESGSMIYWRPYEFELIEEGVTKEQLKEGIRGLLMEWDKFSRYGSPIAKAANEKIEAARKLIKQD